MTTAMQLVDEGMRRERRLTNLSRAVGAAGLDEEIKQNKSALVRKLCDDFNREITMAERCVYLDDFDGALYHGFVANIIHGTIKELEI